MTPLGWIAFLAAAGIGAPARYAIDVWVQDRLAARLTAQRPVGTWTVNVVGCLTAGLLTGLAVYGNLGDGTTTVLVTGGIGALTTFSTFAFETVRMAQEGDVGGAALNVLANLLAGALAAWAGWSIAGLL